MRKITLITTTLVLGCASLAQAASPPGAFSLRTARTVAQRYEDNYWGKQATAIVSPCSWRRMGRVAACPVVITGTFFVVNGTPILTSWPGVDLVTRSGPCSNAGRVVKRVNGVTYQNGGGHYGNCFTGPLVAMPQPG